MHYVGLVVAYTWNREKQTFVALGKEFDMISCLRTLNGKLAMTWLALQNCEPSFEIR